MISGNINQRTERKKEMVKSINIISDFHQELKFNSMNYFYQKNADLSDPDLSYDVMVKLLDTFKLSDYQYLYDYKIHELLDKDKYKNQKNLNKYNLNLDQQQKILDDALEKKPVKQSRNQQQQFDQSMMPPPSTPNNSNRRGNTDEVKQASGYYISNIDRSECFQEYNPYDQKCEE